jgi:hypothetical protein
MLERKRNTMGASKQGRKSLPVTGWLSASAVAVGFGAALMGGSGVANADSSDPVLPWYVTSNNGPVPAAAASTAPAPAAPPALSLTSNPITDTVGLVVGDGTAARPNGGFLYGNGYSYTAASCSTGSCTGGNAGLFGNGGSGYNGGTGGNGGQWFGNGGNGGDGMSASVTGGTGGNAGMFGDGGRGGNGFSVSSGTAGNGGTGGVGGTLLGNGGIGGAGGSALVSTAKGSVTLVGGNGGTGGAAGSAAGSSGVGGVGGQAGYTGTESSKATVKATGGAGVGLLERKIHYSTHEGSSGLC